MLLWYTVFEEGGIAMAFFAKKKLTVPKDADTNKLLQLARETDDPTFQHKLLLRAEILSPESLQVQKALLMLGRLYERKQNIGDFSLIKCHMLDAFDHPQNYTDEILRAKTREIFDHPRLHKCLELAKNPDAFMQEYLDEICRQYIFLFIAGSSSRSPSLFGIRLGKGTNDKLAAYMADILRRILLSPYLEIKEQLLLAKTFYKACYSFFDGGVNKLHGLLGEEILKRLA